MLKYLIILLDDCSASYCHYDAKPQSRLMPVETLRKGILFAMKNNLKIQYVLPQYSLPQEYVELINSMFHICIGTPEQETVADIIVVEDLHSLVGKKLDNTKRYMVRTNIHDFFQEYEILKDVLEKNISVNIVFKDVEKFSDNDIHKYSEILDDLVDSLKSIFTKGGYVNTNLITDRIALDAMNNCGAGDSSITLAPNGKFYPCPAFYYDNDPYCETGDVDSGEKIRNKKLFSLEGAPLCKRCDAYHCKRCIWLNKKLTYEVNIPSRQQCVMAHIERNASKKLLDEFHQLNLLSEKEIGEIDYIDPFDKYQSI